MTRLTAKLQTARAAVRAVALTEAEAAAYLNFSVWFLRKARRGAADGPPYIRRGRTVRYLVRDLDAWLASGRVAH